jgi:uncharacterized protein YcbK (DUF882 family)
MLSKNFSRTEFACKCGCGFDTVDAELLTVLQDLRDWISVPVIINSGCRCEAHNTAVLGTVGSQHLVGRAADIKCVGVDTAVVHQYLFNRYPNKYGLKLYPTWVHIDTGNRFWRG